jgi:hypothetical protein
LELCAVAVLEAAIAAVEDVVRQPLLEIRFAAEPALRKRFAARRRT